MIIKTSLCTAFSCFLFCFVTLTILERHGLKSSVYICSSAAWPDKILSVCASSAWCHVLQQLYPGKQDVFSRYVIFFQMSCSYCNNIQHRKMFSISTCSLLCVIWIRWIRFLLLMWWLVCYPSMTFTVGIKYQIQSVSVLYSATTLSSFLVFSFMCSVATMFRNTMFSMLMPSVSCVLLIYVLEHMFSVCMCSVSGILQ